MKKRIILSCLVTLLAGSLVWVSPATSFVPDARFIAEYFSGDDPLHIKYKHETKYPCTVITDIPTRLNDTMIFTTQFIGGSIPKCITTAVFNDASHAHVYARTRVRYWVKFTTLVPNAPTNIPIPYIIAGSGYFRWQKEGSARVSYSTGNFAYCDLFQFMPYVSNDPLDYSNYRLLYRLYNIGGPNMSDSRVYMRSGNVGELYHVYIYSVFDMYFDPTAGLVSGQVKIFMDPKITIDPNFKVTIDGVEYPGDKVYGIKLSASMFRTGPDLSGINLLLLD